MLSACGAPPPPPPTWPATHGTGGDFVAMLLSAGADPAAKHLDQVVVYLGKVPYGPPTTLHLTTLQP